VRSIVRKRDGYEFACKTVKTDAEEIVKNVLLFTYLDDFRIQKS
jgi:calcium/calmodulin-dependent protein kinase I